MSRATEDLMDTLHGSVATSLTEEIQRYKEGEMKDKEGNVLPIPASLIAQAIKFLKDNGIDSPGRESKVLDPLEEILAEEEEYEDNVVNINR